MPDHQTTSSTSRLFVLITLGLLFLCSCSAVQPISSSSGTEGSLLELQVVPTTAEIYIDGDYQGIVEGWRDQILPVKTGHRRLELRAVGHITQRFDLDVEEGQLLTLRARLESTIDELSPDEESPQSPQNPLQAPEHPGAPTPESR